MEVLVFSRAENGTREIKRKVRGRGGGRERMTLLSIFHTGKH